MDDQQQAYMHNEHLIVVDENDQVIGKKTKAECHYMTNISAGLLHRAFSVFLFNTAGELLLQQRSTHKITFPLQYTNTCCSHPLHTPEEMDTEGNIGVKRAALRKLEHEMGIPRGTIDLSAVQFLTRIRYTAPYDSKWGESEIDYVLIVQQDVAPHPNPNEVASHMWVSKGTLQDLMKRASAYTFTPWFRLICSHFLFQWWDRLSDVATCSDDRIHLLEL